MELIKKYENRKLYSTTLSKYVSIDYILDLVKTDQKFKVVDNSNSKDITTEIIKRSLTKLPMTLETMTNLIKGRN